MRESPSPSDLAKLDRELIERRGLREYCRRAWPQIEPSPLAWSWHHDALCEHLSAVYACDIRNLLICIPPGFSKSNFASVLAPSWAWTKWPSTKFIASTYAQDLSDKDAIKILRLVRSHWYHERFGHRVQVPRWATKRIRMFENAQKGFRFSTSVGGELTGRHGDVLIGDDLINVKDARNTAKIEQAVEFWFARMASRQANPMTTRKIVIMQRVSHIDVAQHCIDSGDYETLIIPMEYSHKTISYSTRAYEDPRKEEGELLWPERVGPKEIAKLRTDLGDAYECQYNQVPSAPGGAIFKSESFRYWGHTGCAPYETLPLDRFLHYSISVDCSFKNSATADMTSMLVWAQKGGDFLLIDRIARRMEFTEMIEEILGLLIKYPVREKYVEAAANGHAVISALRRDIPGMIDCKPIGSKEARAHAVQGYYRSGNVFHPHPKICPWVKEYEKYLTAFPRGKFDDDVDATSQYLSQKTEHDPTRTMAKLRALAQASASR